MTNKEAIDILESMIGLHDAAHWKLRIEALRMAVKALQKNEATCMNDEKMQDVIYRQAAIDLINARLSQPCKNHTSEFVQGMEDGYCRIRSDIKCLSSVRKKGKWLEGQCSICGCDIPAYIIDWKWQKDMDANFCPNCGARMVKEGKEHDES